MQIQLYTVPVFDNGASLEDVNRFLRGHKVLEVQQEFVSNEHGSYWCFCIRYLTGPSVFNTRNKKGKIDYKEELDEKTFEVFALLRDCRKQIAEEEAIPAYAVFTNAELAKIASLPELLAEKLQSINGIGNINKSQKTTPGLKPEGYFQSDYKRCSQSPKTPTAPI